MNSLKKTIAITTLVTGLALGVSSFALATQTTAPAVNATEVPKITTPESTAPSEAVKETLPISTPVPEAAASPVSTPDSSTKAPEVKTETSTTPALVEPTKPKDPTAETKTEIKTEEKKAEPKKDDVKKEDVKKDEAKKEEVKKPVAKKSTPKKPVPLSKKEQDAILTKVQDHIRSIRTLKARFKQTAEVYSKDLTGTLYVMRPGRLRFEYDPPVHDYIVADGRFIYFYDSELKTASHTLISNTLAAFLIQADADLFKGNIQVIDMTVNEASKNKMLGLTVIDGDEPEQGRITLIFEQKPAFKLVKWQVVDANGYVTQVELEKIQTGVEIDKSIFKYIPKDISNPDYN